MVVAMFEQSPKYFKKQSKYQKIYQFFVSEILKTDIAMAHTSRQGCGISHLFCCLSEEKHYYVPVDLESEITRQSPVKCYVVPCL